MKTIKIDNLEVLPYDLGQVELSEIHELINWKDGWRIPSKSELQLIHQHKIKNGGFEDKYYWSSSYYITDRSFSGAWAMHFGNGRQFHFGECFPAYVLCVRSKEDKDYLKNGIVELGFANNLEVIKCDLGFMSWEEADKEINKLGDDWRIPTVSELKSIKEYKNQIGGLLKDYYWGVSNNDKIEKSTYCFLGEYDSSNKDEVKNGLIAVRSQKKINISFENFPII